VRPEPAAGSGRAVPAPRPFGWAMADMTNANPLGTIYAERLPLPVTAVPGSLPEGATASCRTAIPSRRHHGLGGSCATVAKDTVRSQCAVPERPPQRATTGMRGRVSRRDRQHRALGMSEAVTAHPAGEDPGQRAATARPDDKQIGRVAGDNGEHAAGGAALDHRPDRQISGELSPCRVNCVPQSLPGVFGPEAAQLYAGTAPFGDLAARRRPAMNGYQDGVIGAGKVFCIAQRTEVAR